VKSLILCPQFIGRTEAPTRKQKKCNIFLPTGGIYYAVLVTFKNLLDAVRHYLALRGFYAVL